MADVDLCYACIKTKAEIARVQAENAKLQATMRLAKRVINEVEYEKAEKMNTLNVAEATRLLVIEALDRTGGNRTIAADLLGVARSTLFEWMKLYGIKDKHSRRPAYESRVQEAGTG